MESERGTRTVYRLLVRLPAHEVVYAARLFRQSEQAIAEVAAAVRHHARDSEVVGIILQRGAAAENAAEHAATRAANRHSVQRWTPVERWGTDVVRRILAQSGDDVAPRTVPTPPPVASPDLPRPGPGPTAAPLLPVLTTAAAPLPVAAPVTADAAAPLQSDLPVVITPAPPHVAPGNGVSAPLAASPAALSHHHAAARMWLAGHRWHIGLALAIMVLAWLLFIVLLSGSRLLDLLGVVGRPRAQVATELPFDPPPAILLHPTPLAPDVGAGRPPAQHVRLDPEADRWLRQLF